MKRIEIMDIDERKYIRIMMLSRIANGCELFPTYEPSEEEVEEMYPVLKELSYKMLLDSPIDIMPTAGVVLN